MGILGPWQVARTKTKSHSLDLKLYQLRPSNLRIPKREPDFLSLTMLVPSGTQAYGYT